MVGSILDVVIVATKLKRYIASADPKNVIQVCFVKTAAMKNVPNNIKLLMTTHISAKVYGALFFNMLLKDWRKQRCGKDIVDTTKDLVKCIQSH